MSDEQALAFLAHHHVTRLPYTEWRPGEPLIFVFKDLMVPRRAFGELIVEMKPNLVRVDNPVQLNSFMLISSGQCDYYAIDARTSQIVRVKVSDRSKTSGAVTYEIAANYLFHTADHLFPKGPPPARK